MVQNEVGEIFIQLGDQVFKLENENLEKTNIKISADDEIFFQDGKFTSINKLNKLNVKIKFSENQSFVWNKYLAKTGTENYGIYYKDKLNHYWVLTVQIFYINSLSPNFLKEILSKCPSEAF
jgi:S-adenosylmethionine:tRNA-ribosyltransferase-isomerase (queuine synthetase)